MIGATMWNVGTCYVMVREKFESGGPTRTKVLRCITGAEQFVVAMKVG